ncbi:MAG: prenyltransferase/squalene oxidase repeat-containing protein [Bacteroidota bacterium]
MNRTELLQKFSHLGGILQSSLNERGFWEGELSSSALATAVSVVALEIGDPDLSRERIARGITWLAGTINPDGGFGDTPGSFSNVSTTLLCYAAFRFCSPENTDGPAIQLRMAQYLACRGVDVESTGIVRSILGYYGKDYTFSLPILSMLVLCKVLDEKALEEIPQLPFELTLLPLSLYRFFNLQVVSYAIPALVAVGIYLFSHKPKPNPVAAFIRNKATGPALVKLEKMMPESGGFLEAIPLTAFVSMCLARSGYPGHPVVEKGMDFLRNLQRTDGSWPIDTDLATWVTTLGIKALGRHLSDVLTETQRDRLRQYLLGTQYRLPHRFNNARPGGWGWTSFTGSVPDADDTAGAILALLTLKPDDGDVKTAVLRGCEWLAGLQNHDGGIPTFCRGWGRLPFDASCADLTGHALLAWHKAVESYGLPPAAIKDEKEIRKLEKHASRALRFLERSQHSNGSWLPLWFGNQHTGDKTNPVYGTARVTCYLDDIMGCNGVSTPVRNRIEPLISKARHYLSIQQNDDGSWGAEKGVAGSIEETAMAVSALAGADPVRCMKGLNWLEGEYNARGLVPKPVGLYFATLWYHEKMYPLVWYLEALRRMTDVSISAAIPEM